MRITPIGQSGYIIKCRDTEIIIDPYLSDIVNEVAGRERLVPAPINPEDINADAVICTHDHLDHLDMGAIPKMDKGLLFVTTNEGKSKINGEGFKNVISLNVGESISVGDIELTAVFADHTVEAFGLIVKGDGQTLYFSGDTLYNEELFSISDYHPDITFICINGRLGNMNVDEAIVCAGKIGAPINIPNHYDMFASNSEDPKLFTDRIVGGMILSFNREYDLDKIIKD